jgi:hypothetical protein
MEESMLFVLESVALLVYPKSYLVEVRQAPDDMPRSDWQEIPDWVFRSNRAIWLTMENASMMRRAQRGESIRRRLLPEWVRHNGRADV